MTDKEIKIFLSEYLGAGPFTLRAGTYKSLKEDVHVVSASYWWAVRDTVPDDVVYNILWAIYGEGRHKRWLEASPANINLHPLETGPGTEAIPPPIPLHPGAEKYWKAWGLKMVKPLSETMLPSPEEYANKPYTREDVLAIHAQR